MLLVRSGMWLYISLMKTETRLQRPPENSITLQRIFESAIDAARGPWAEPHARVNIGYIVIDQPEAT